MFSNKTCIVYIFSISLNLVNDNQHSRYNSTLSNSFTFNNSSFSYNWTFFTLSTPLILKNSLDLLGGCWVSHLQKYIVIQISINDSESLLIFFHGRCIFISITVFYKSPNIIGSKHNFICIHYHSFSLGEQRILKTGFHSTSCSVFRPDMLENSRTSRHPTL